MTCGHLFNGISGFGLAASWMGWQNLMHCEIDPFCNRVMKHHFPNSFQHEDIRTTDFRIWRGRIDLITGGFPCQPFSAAGDRIGTEDPRYLWPPMLRSVREIKPRWVVAENVYGVVSWNNGVVFEQVQADLENEGYEVGAYILPACGVNAPHRRDRIWFIANRSGQLGGQKGGTKETNDCQRQTGEYVKEGDKIWNKSASIGECGNVANPDCEQLQRIGAGSHSAEGRENEGRQSGESAGNHWGAWPTQPPVCTGNDGLPGGLVDITFSKWRNESLKALGNSIVPQVAYQIFKAIEQYENL